MVGKYPVITLCGSTRFKEQFLEAQKRLTLAADIKILKGKKLLDYIKKYDKKYIQKKICGISK